MFLIKNANYFYNRIPFNLITTARATTLKPKSHHLNQNKEKKNFTVLLHRVTTTCMSEVAQGNSSQLK